MTTEVLNKLVYDEDVEHRHGDKRQADKRHVGNDEDGVDPGVDETDAQADGCSCRHDGDLLARGQLQRQRMTDGQIAVQSNHGEQVLVDHERQGQDARGKCPRGRRVDNGANQLQAVAYEKDNGHKEVVYRQDDNENLDAASILEAQEDLEHESVAYDTQSRNWYVDGNRDILTVAHYH